MTDNRVAQIVQIRLEIEQLRSALNVLPQSLVEARTALEKQIVERDVQLRGLADIDTTFGEGGMLLSEDEYSQNLEGSETDGSSTLQVSTFTIESGSDGGAELSLTSNSP